MTSNERARLHNEHMQAANEVATAVRCLRLAANRLDHGHYAIQIEQAASDLAEVQSSILKAASNLI